MYRKPIVKSEDLYEKSALKCSDYNYYSQMETGCTTNYEGSGKEEAGTCYEQGLYS